MADTFGGKAAKAGQGFCVGVRDFQIEGQHLKAQVCHQDQVIELPPGARAIGRADYCANGVIAYDFPALSMQFHPEYRAHHLRDLFIKGRDVLLPPTEADEAMTSVNAAKVSDDLAARQAVELFRGTYSPN